MTDKYVLFAQTYMASGLNIEIDLCEQTQVNAGLRQVFSGFPLPKGSALNSPLSKV